MVNKIVSITFFLFSTSLRKCY